MLLWRYFSASGWDRLVGDPRLPLTRIAGFDDGFECAVPVFAHMHRNPKDVRPDMMSESARQRRNFASCWFADEHESIALWELFVGRKPGVAVALLYADLQAMMPSEATLAPVQYVRHDDAGADLAFDRPELWPFYKLWGFRHEREVRLVVPDSPELVEKTDADGRRGVLCGTDLFSALRSVRVFAPRKSECDDLLEVVSASGTNAVVSRTLAYPKQYRSFEGDWWIEGMEPTPIWQRRMLEAH